VPTASATVLRVVDGDSLEVELGGVVTELRLVGINAPEGDECHGDTSRDTLESIVTSAGGIVEVAENDEERDQFGRLLGYVSADGVDINALLLATGNAMALQSGHVRQNGYLRLTEAAFADGAGMWRLGACGAATVDRGDVRIVAVEPDPPGRDEERLVDELVVIGNSSDRAVDLSGWTLRDDSTANRYVFPTGVVLDQGSEVTVRVGCGRDDALTRFWCSDTPVWSNDGDSVVLLDASGNVIDLLVYRG
jgi:micrococcal nuclease